MAFAGELGSWPAVVLLREERILDSWVWILIGVAYLTLFFWLGLATLRNGHGWLFFFGIFFPILWIFGAFAGPAEAR